MPELPEVETVRRGLAAAVGGRRVEAVTVTHPRTVRRRPDGFVAGVAGRTVEAVDRLGKFLLLRLDGGEVLVAHLRMSGQLLVVPPGAPTAPHTHAVLALGGPGPPLELRFVDPRTFGELFLCPPPAEPGGVPVELAHLGPDALDPRVDGRHLHARLAGRRAPLKALLLDQRIVAGIGNIYGDEVLHEARLAPARPGGAVGPREAARLAGALHRVLEEAVEAGGSTLADAQYVDVHGGAGGYQQRHRAYGRAGRPCPRCGTPIARGVLAQRSTHWCPRCQR